MKRMGRKILGGLATAALIGGWALAAPVMHATHDKAEGAETTIAGEVIDLHCFMIHPDTGKGADHASCAQLCISKGLPIGFLANDGTVYLLLGKDHNSIKGIVGKLAGKPSEVTGVVINHDGVKAIQMSSIKALKPAKEMKPAATAPATGPAAGTVAKDVWTCPMGDYTGDKPGNCPKCGMMLEKKKG